MILHVACLPFPSPQGTQAAIDAMLRAWCAAEHEAQLVTYAHGSDELDAPYTVHRLPDFPKVRSLRSGPSFGKVALDVRCITELRALGARRRPAAIVAHHVEAAGAALAAGIGPVFYVAHTSLSHELPLYFPRVAELPIRRAAGLVEGWICARSRGVAAVVPSLAPMLGDQTHYLPVPWSPDPRMVTRRRDARMELGLPADARVCLYAGNLDRYQGWEHLIDALASLRAVVARARLLVATESDPASLWQRAEEVGVSDAIQVHELGSERARAVVHGASDVAWVPRRARGGLPIKMLDAFARGLPVVAQERATAGLPIHDVCRVVPDDDPGALAAATADLFERRDVADDLRERARAYLRTSHDPSVYVASMRRWMGLDRVTQPTTMRVELRPRAEPARQAR